MDQTLIKILDETRRQIGVPLHCSSGFRCPSHNSAVGGAKGSKHLDKIAADITFGRRAYRTGTNILRLFVIMEKIGRDYGGLGLGIYPTWVHVDTRTLDGTRAARWSKFNWPKLT